MNIMDDFNDEVEVQDADVDIFVMAANKFSTGGGVLTRCNRLENALGIDDFSKWRPHMRHKNFLPDGLHTFLATYKDSPYFHTLVEAWKLRSLEKVK